MPRHGSRIKKLEAHRTRSASGSAELPSDPIAFARSLGIEPDQWQRDLLIATDKRIILNCARQSGKSTIAAMLALYRALTTPKSLVLILSPTLRQSGLLFEKITEFYDKCEGSRHDARSATALTLANQSRIVSLPGSEGTVRGFSAPSLVLIDEASQVSDDLYYAVSPMFAVSQGQLILLSTPRGKEGIFWRAWSEGKGWNKIMVPAEQCPRISQEFLDHERQSMSSTWFAQEYGCEFVQPEGSLFNEPWIKYYEPGSEPAMDAVVQSWDTALTKSETSDYVVGQVWGRSGAHFYLLDQVRGKFDFDETVARIEMLSSKWPQSTAKVIEAQALGASLASHLRDRVDGIIAVHVRESKEMRALNCLPAWQSGNVFLPRPDNTTYAWVHEFVHELITFPSSAHDDMVDAMTLALNRLRGPLFQRVRQRVVETKRTEPLPNRFYRIGLVLAGPESRGVIIVLDDETNDVVSFEWVAAATAIDDQIDAVNAASCMYNDAFVRAVKGVNEAVLRRIESKGIPVERVVFTAEKWATACENLSMLIANERISYPYDPDLVAELEVFKADSTLGAVPEYTLEVGHNAAIRALCLVTYDQSAEDIDWTWATVYWLHDDPYDDSCVF